MEEEKHVLSANLASLAADLKGLFVTGSVLMSTGWEHLVNIPPSTYLRKYYY